MRPKCLLTFSASSDMADQPDSGYRISQRIAEFPNKFDQIQFGTVKETLERGRPVFATIYFGSPESSCRIVEVSQAFTLATNPIENGR